MYYSRNENVFENYARNLTFQKHEKNGICDISIADRNVLDQSTFLVKKFQWNQ